MKKAQESIACWYPNFALTNLCEYDDIWNTRYAHGCMNILKIIIPKLQLSKLWCFFLADLAVFMAGLEWYCTFA